MQGTTAAAFAASKPPTQFSEPLDQNLQCPRCESQNTKFCYYNNYNLSQPRYFCKDCRRYWTKGGSLRNVPVGGGSRKNSKRSSSAAAAAAAAATSLKRASPSSSAGEVKKTQLFSPSIPPVDDDHRMLDMSGSFSSLLSSNAHFGNFFEGYHSIDSLPIYKGVSRHIMEPDVQSSAESSVNDGGTVAAPSLENFLGLSGDPSGWAGGWPDLSIYTPGTSFQ